jgi:hypothetical protein
MVHYTKINGVIKWVLTPWTVKGETNDVSSKNGLLP